MDQKASPDAPLLYEIASIDVGNLGGRKNRSKPHIILYAKDGTQIFWGAAYGQAKIYLEAGENEKIASLYKFYDQHGSVQGVARYIELRIPRKGLPRPEMQ